MAEPTTSDWLSWSIVSQAALPASESKPPCFYAATARKKRQAIEFEDTTMAKAFERTTSEELEAYDRDGTLPAWFPRTTSPSID
jgi:hypothetical protein